MEGCDVHEILQTNMNITKCLSTWYSVKKQLQTKEIGNCLQIGVTVSLFSYLFHPSQRIDKICILLIRIYLYSVDGQKQTCKIYNSCFQTELVKSQLLCIKYCLCHKVSADQRDRIAQLITKTCCIQLGLWRKVSFNFLPKQSAYIQL